MIRNKTSHLESIYKNIIFILIMHSKRNSTKKINLILISLEALDIYRKHRVNINCNNFISYLQQVTFRARHSKNIVNTNLVHSFNSTDNISLLYAIYLISLQVYIRKVTHQALDHYYTEQKSKIITKYLNRFRYIYNKTQNYNYYDIEDNHSHLKIKNLAMTNLYIINQIGKKNNLYYLVKYIYV